MLRQELKKIWRPGIVLATLVIAFAYYPMFLNIYVKDRDAVWDMEMAWMEEYGTSFSPREMEAIADTLLVLYAQADGYIAAHPIAQAHGLESYEDYTRWKSITIQPEDSLDEQQLYDYLCSYQTEDIMSRILQTEAVVEQYRLVQEQVQIYGYINDFFEEITPREINHAKAVFHGADEVWQNFLPSGATNISTATDFAILTVLCLYLLLGPALTRDRIMRMVPLQYASRRGRNVAWIQLAAYLLTAVIVATASLLLHGALIVYKSGWYAFLNCRTFSFFTAMYCWPNWSLGVWYLVLAAIHYIMALTVASVLFLLSRCSGNHISMLLKAIPAFAAFVYFLSKLMTFAFYYANRLYRFTGIPYIETIVPPVLAALSLTLCAVFIKHIMRQDILTS